jgi:predicted acyl esterase
MIEKNIMVPMRDGVKLATDVYRQDGVTSAPALVTRTPYNKDGIINGFDVIRAVEAGYVVAVQDVRGRYASEGTGPIELELHLFVSSSAPDTDFTGKLVDVFPDGRAIILTEGILRARYRNSFSEPEQFEPSTIYEIKLDL